MSKQPNKEPSDSGDSEMFAKPIRAVHRLRRYGYYEPHVEVTFETPAGTTAKVEVSPETFSSRRQFEVATLKHVGFPLSPTVFHGSWSATVASLLQLGRNAERPQAS